MAWLLPLGLALHELEEWNIRGWYERYWTNLPPLSDPPLHAFLVFVISGGLFGTFVATRLRDDRHFTAAILVFFATLPPFANGLQHLYWTFAFGSYSPGVVTGVLLVVPLVLFFAWRVVRDGVLPARVVGCFFLPTPFLLVWTAVNGTDASGVHAIVRFGTWLLDVFA